jgi:hypothetical protein
MRAGDESGIIIPGQKRACVRRIKEKNMIKGTHKICMDKKKNAIITAGAGSWIAEAVEELR